MNHPLAPRPIFDGVRRAGCAVPLRRSYIAHCTALYNVQCAGCARTILSILHEPPSGIPSGTWYGACVRRAYIHAL